MVIICVTGEWEHESDSCNNEDPEKKAWERRRNAGELDQQIADMGGWRPHRPQTLLGTLSCSSFDLSKLEKRVVAQSLSTVSSLSPFVRMATGFYPFSLDRLDRNIDVLSYSRLDDSLSGFATAHNAFLTLDGNSVYTPLFWQQPSFLSKLRERGRISETSIYDINREAAILPYGFVEGWVDTFDPQSGMEARETCLPEMFPYDVFPACSMVKIQSSVDFRIESKKAAKGFEVVDKWSLVKDERTGLSELLVAPGLEVSYTKDSKVVTGSAAMGFGSLAESDRWVRAHEKDRATPHDKDKRCAMWKASYYGFNKEKGFSTCVLSGGSSPDFLYKPVPGITSSITFVDDNPESERSNERQQRNIWCSSVLLPDLSKAVSVSLSLPSSTTYTERRRYTESELSHHLLNEALLSSFAQDMKMLGKADNCNLVGSDLGKRFKKINSELHRVKCALRMREQRFKLLAAKVSLLLASVEAGAAHISDVAEICFDEFDLISLLSGEFNENLVSSLVTTDFVFLRDAEGRETGEIKRVPRDPAQDPAVKPKRTRHTALRSDLLVQLLNLAEEDYFVFVGKVASLYRQRTKEACAMIYADSRKNPALSRPIYRFGIFEFLGTEGSVRCRKTGSKETVDPNPVSLFIQMADERVVSVGIADLPNFCGGVDQNIDGVGAPRLLSETSGLSSTTDGLLEASAGAAAAIKDMVVSRGSTLQMAEEVESLTDLEGLDEKDPLSGILSLSVSEVLEDQANRDFDLNLGLQEMSNGRFRLDYT